MSLEAICKAARETAALFEMDSRGCFEVAGSERVRWLDGMISGDVARLEQAGVGAGCYATLLTNRGKIVADLHVGNLGEVFAVETRRDAVAHVLETLERFIIADDVTLRDISAQSQTFALEGPACGEILKRAVLADAAAASETSSKAHDFELPAADCWTEVELAGATVRVAAFGFSGERAYQVIAPLAAADAVRAALQAAGEASGLVAGNAEALEVLRVEAGIPALGAELSDSRLPPEARLEHAIAVNKGCYVGQEIVARLRARGQVNHLLVGFALNEDAPALAGTELSAGGRRTGEVTSCVSSPRFGKIALGYVRREHSEPGTPVEFEGGRAEVVALPFVPTHAPTQEAP